MLILSRKVGESIVIADSITITIIAIDGRNIRLGITAPKETAIHRDDAKRKEPRPPCQK